MSLNPFKSSCSFVLKIHLDPFHLISLFGSPMGSPWIPQGIPKKKRSMQQGISVHLCARQEGAPSLGPWVTDDGARCDFFRWQSPWKYIWRLWTIIYHYKSKRLIYNDFYMFIKPIHIHLTIPESTVNHRIQPLMSQLRYLGGPILCHYHGRRCFGQWWIIDEPYSDDIFLAQFPSNKSLA